MPKLTIEPIAKRGRGRPAKYPWEKWLVKVARGTLTLTQGRDYECYPHAMMQQFRAAAHARGVSVRISLGTDRITVRLREEET